MNWKTLNQASRALIIAAVIGLSISALGLGIGMTAAVDLQGSTTSVVVILSFYMSLAAVGAAGIIETVSHFSGTNGRKK